MINPRRQTLLRAILLALLVVVVTAGSVAIAYRDAVRTAEERLSGQARLIARGLEVALSTWDGGGQSLDPEFFTPWLRGLALGVGGSAAVVALDLTLAAREPALPTAVGRPVADLRLAHFVAEAQRDAIYRVRSPLDAVERIVVVRRLEGLPWLVVLGLASDEVLASWHRQTAAAVLLALLLLAVLALATRRALQLERQADALAWRSHAVDASDDAIVITDAEGVIEYANPAFFALTGYSAAEAVGQTPRLLKSGCQSPAFYSRLWATIRGGTPWRGEVVNRRKDGSYYHDLLTVSPVRNAHGRVVRFISTHHDISQRKRMEDELTEMAHFDPLTGLPNRALFLDRSRRAVVEARREQSGFALLFIDLDGFKAVNDRHGHETGDVLLREVARRVAACLRETDTVARQGGDEFAVLLRGVHRADVAGAIAQKIIDAVGALREVAGCSCHVGASVGIAVHPDQGVDVESLLRNADSAMYEAKRRGKNCWVCAGNVI